ncbi:MAG TPA: hypothetical protein VL400_15275, partial [Polyangiaceae bacterium]|jgi:hypothetical protein|nr:hypothetical protein [Polyangiaceae bacterium]
MRTRLGARLVAGVVALSSWGLACKQILDVPTEPGEVTAAVRKFCSCDGVTNQGDEVAGACDDALAGEGADVEALALAAAEQDPSCTQCFFTDQSGTKVPDLEKTGACYAAITGAVGPGDACATNADCSTFACCGRDLAITAKSFDVAYTGKCCDAGEVCLGCAATYGKDLPAGVADASLCAEGIDAFNVLVDCLCAAHTLADGCATECDPSCRFGMSACRECLIQAHGEACVAETDACTASESHPVDEP